MAAKDVEEAPETEATETPSPMLDMSQAAVKKMIAQAKAKGYITLDELNRALPPAQVSSEQIEDVMSLLSEMGVNVVEEEEAEDGAAAEAKEESREVATTTTTGAENDRTDDPVRMYLREMGTVELLSREGEIAIAKRIEAGRATMIGGLCESPLTFQAITIWLEELNDERIMLRDVIDLETTFGKGLEDDEETVVDLSAAQAAPPSPRTPSRASPSPPPSTTPRRAARPTRMARSRRSRPTCRSRRWRRRSGHRCWRSWSASPATTPSCRRCSPSASTPR